MSVNFEDYMKNNDMAINQLVGVVKNQNEMIKIIKEESVRTAVDKTSEILNDLKTTVALLNKNYSILENNYNNAIEKISNVEKDNSKLKEKVFVLRNDQEGKYNDYKKVARARVRKLVGSGTIEDVLFYRSFLPSLHNTVSSVLYVSNTGNIKVEDVDTAIGIAGKWRPDKRLLRRKFNEYYNRYQSGSLKSNDEKYIAFEKYLKKTNGGRNLEF